MWVSPLCGLVAVGLAAALNACGPARPPAAAVPGPQPNHRAFFGPEDLGTDAHPVTADSYWRPALADVEPFEVALDSALSAARATRTHDRPRGLEEYTVQYVGYVLDGRRRIFANAACDDVPDAGTRWFTVVDGGACYFTVSFDPGSARLIDLLFNGQA